VHFNQQADERDVDRLDKQAEIVAPTSFGVDVDAGSIASGLVGCNCACLHTIAAQKLGVSE